MEREEIVEEPCVQMKLKMDPLWWLGRETEVRRALLGAFRNFTCENRRELVRFGKRGKMPRQQ